MKTLIAGIGNIFLGDDAFGSVLASRLAARSWPEGVAVRDFGIRCLELAYAILDDWDEVILLDAAPRGGRPGTLYRIALDGEPAAADVDPHTISAAMVLGMARRIGGRLPRATLLGCEPASCQPDYESNPGLSPAVAAALPAAEAMITELFASQQQEASA